MSLERASVYLCIVHDASIRDYMKFLIEDNEKVIFATNGRMGISLAEEITPDLIIAQNNVPEISGYQICNHLKFLPATKHIPFVLIAIEGIKPEQKTGLEAEPELIWNNIQSQEIHLNELKNLSCHNSEKPQNGLTAKGEIQNRIVAIIEENYKNADFGVEELAHQLGSNRVKLTKLFRKNFNTSPGKYLRNLRLEKARELLARSQFSIAEITYGVGFNHPSYFAKCFKEQFNFSPKEYIAKFSSVQ